MKHTLFSIAAAAMLMAPLAACDEQPTYVPEDLESLNFPDGLEVIVYEPPQSSAASINRTADRQLEEPKPAMTAQDFLDGMNTRNDSPDFFGGIHTRNDGKTAGIVDIGHEQVLDEEFARLEQDPPLGGITHGDPPQLPQNEDGTFNIPDDLQAADDVYDQTAALEDPCLCEGPTCLQDWIDENVGCDVCVAFMCGENTMGACSICPADEVLGQ